MTTTLVSPGDDFSATSLSGGIDDPPAPSGPSFTPNEKARALLPEAHRAPLSWATVYSSFVANQLAELEPVWAALKARWDVMSQSGAQLDIIGEIVQRPRNGLSDAAYQVILLTQIQAFTSNESIPAISALVRKLVDAFGGETFDVREVWPKNIFVTINSAYSGDLAVTYEMLDMARGAGVALHLITTPTTDAETFCFEGGAGLGFNEGELASVVGPGSST